MESILTRPIELAGKSGARYRYTTLEEERFLPPAGANFVIAELTREGARVVFAGETDNLANQTWRTTLEKARQTYSKAKILTRLNVTRAVREAERIDLIEQYEPPLNSENRPRGSAKSDAAGESSARE
ncbi:hypothetical protein [Phenylobacterium sp.]|uniref:hypothetical protein n=1 Tax=Phenylobacterium sp. TaxID=1871053 RepID=UPI002DE37DD7|nr:hypothetical protein [Phenylobacterium sp.]